VHPASGERLEISAPLPAPLPEVLAELGLAFAPGIGPAG